MDSPQAPSPTIATGQVYLIGAGPGDPQLLTLRGLACLQQADVILYDYLANPRILAWANPAAEKICLGQHGRTRIWTQTEINAALIDQARRGRRVARLKGGDPAIFARGGDEVEALAQANIPFEMVPGITAALAAGSYAGVPITHREAASAVALVTGHEDGDKQTSAIDYSALAHFPGTLVFYMGVTTARTWTAALLAAGKSPATPTAIVRRCTTADQRVVRCRLDEVVQRLETPPRIRPPAIIIVGDVAALDPSPSWFERRPLFGRRVMVTRPLDQAEPLARLLEENGAETVIQPAISITPTESPERLDAALNRLDTFDWLVFSSSNGVRYLLERLLLSGRDLRALGRLKIAAIGTGTAEELARFHLRADLIPAEFRAEQLAEELSRTARGLRFLLARASRGREVLAETLQNAGAQVEQVVVYDSRDVATPDPDVAELLQEGRIDWITVTSSAIARSLANLFGDDLRRAKLASISPITSATLRAVGFEPAAEASVYTMLGVVTAILDHERQAT